MIGGMIGFGVGVCIYVVIRELKYGDTEGSEWLIGMLGVALGFSL